MEEYNIQNQIKRIALSLFGLILLGALCSYLFKSSIQSLGLWTIEKMGIYGIVLGTLITDTSPIPLTSEPIALIGLGADLNVVEIIVAMSITSHFAGPIGYGCGYLLKTIPNVQDFAQSRFPTIFQFMRNHGIKGVCMGALLPIPYALTTWTAGLVGVSFWGTVAASSLRWIKTAVFVSLIWVGWTAVP